MLLAVAVLHVLKVTVCFCDVSFSQNASDLSSIVEIHDSTDADILDKEDIEEMYETKPTFKNKVVLITGASSGVGKVIAYYFASLGAKLILTGKDFDRLERVGQKCKIYGADELPYLPAGDLTNPEHVKYIVRTTINHYTTIDILINCAGILELGGITNTSLGQFDRTFNINVRAMYDITMQCVPYLKESSGTIINISSIAGLRAFPGLIAYCMSKAAVDQFTRCLALELAHYHVRVNSINPGVMDTGLHKRHGMDEMAYRTYIRNSLKERIHPLGRIATVEDVAKAVVFLASEQAAFTTGMNFPVDGGRGIACPR